MSKSRIVEMECPECGKKQEFEVHDSINVTLEPDLLNKLLDNSIFTFKCNDCGYEEVSLYPVLYHDMEKKLMVQLCPLDQVDHYKEMFKGSTEFMAKEFSISDGYKYRIVSNLKVLSRKEGLGKRLSEQDWLRALYWGVM